MDWIFDNFQVVVFIVVAVVWVMRAVFGAKRPEEEAEPSRGPATAEDPGEAERARQIQEEIRRRILARQRGEMPSAPPSPPPPPVVVYSESEREPPGYLEEEKEEYVEEGPRVPMPSAAARRQSDAAQAAILERQRQLADQLHALRVSRAAGTVVAPLQPFRLPRGASAAISAHQRSCLRELRRDLHQPSSLRRAVLLREILGEPLALRRDTEFPRR